jgi:phosphoglycolate phosphatase
MTRYELLIFDFDGTLADSAEWMVRTLNDIAVPFGLRQVSDDEVAMLRGRSNQEIVRYLGVPLWKLPGIAAEMRRRIAHDIAELRLFDGVSETLRSLDELGLKLAIVSSNSQENVRHILGPENVGRIDTFECSASMFGKASKLRTVMRRMGTTPHDTLCIGDETRDIDAARDVGASIGTVTWGYAKREILEQYRPTHMFDSLADSVAACVVTNEPSSSQ